MSNDIDFQQIKAKVDACCKKCPVCAMNNCVIFFAQQVVDAFIKKGERLYTNGLSKIPSSDTKTYDQNKLIDAAVETLLQCRECSTNHVKDCSINVIRAAIERLLLHQNFDDYSGTVLQHIVQISSKDVNIGNTVLSKFKERTK